MIMNFFKKKYQKMKEDSKICIICDMKIIDKNFHRLKCNHLMHKYCLNDSLSIWIKSNNYHHFENTKISGYCSVCKINNYSIVFTHNFNIKIFEF